MDGPCGYDDNKPQILKTEQPRIVFDNEKPVAKTENTVDDSELCEYSLPPDPVPFRQWTKDDNRYSDDKTDFISRINFKLLKLWILWATCVTQKDIIRFLQEETKDKDSIEYQLKVIIVEILDALAKCLIDTDIKEEFRWLCQQKQKSQSTT